MSCALILLYLASAASFSVAIPPHVVYILADDLGYSDLGYKDPILKTPNLDGLKASGVELDQYYTQSVCSPSRTTTMTGRYPLHVGINDWLESGDSVGVPLTETFLAQVFNAAGYATHAVGKWHMGFYTWAHTPTFRGFDSFYGFYSGGEDYFDHMAGGKYDMRHDAQPKCGQNCSIVDHSASGTYSTNLFTTKAVEVVQSHDASTPLFLYLAYQAVHAPKECPQSYVDPYNDTIKDLVRRNFAGMVSAMDEGVGNVTAALRAKGMFDNTLLVFASDNGGAPQDTPGGDYAGQSNFPLKGGKHGIYEGGCRVLAFLTGHGVTKPRTVSSHLFHAVDWLPTLAAAAGISLSVTPGILPLDGVNQWEDLNGRATSAPRQEVWYGEYDDPVGGNALRVGDWKLYVGNPQHKPDRYFPPPNKETLERYLAVHGSVPVPHSAVWTEPEESLMDMDPGHAKDLGVPSLWTATREELKQLRGVQQELRQPEAGTCTINNFTCFQPPGASSYVNSGAECCDLCLNTSTCQQWTIYGFKMPYVCELHNQQAKLANACPGLSGSGAAGLPPQAVLLFNLTQDPTESTDLSAQHPDVVQQLLKRMLEYVGSGVPQAVDDPSCKHPPSSSVLEPWC